MRLPGTILGITLGVVALAACAPAAAPQTTTTTGSQTQPNTPQLAADQSLTVGQNAIPATMDPMATLGSNPRRYGLYESLLGQKDDGTLEPQLASEWKAINDNTWQFKLVAGRKWHDGTPVTAEDVVFSYQRALDSSKKFAITGARTGNVKDAVKVDDSTVNIITSAPDPRLQKIAYMIPILPKAYIDKVGDKDFEVKPIGSGPFKVVEWRPNDRVVLEAVTEHPRKATLTKLTVRVIPEASGRVAGLKTGDLDIANQLPYDQVDSIKSNGITVVPFDKGYSWGAWMDTLLPDSPSKDKRVRQAFNYAIDKDVMIKNIYKGLTIAEQGQIVQKDTFGFNPDLKPYPFDPKKAKELLAAAGYPNGFKMKLDAYGFNAEAQQVWVFVQAALKDIGVEAELNTYADSASNSDKFYGRVARNPITGVSVINTPAGDADFAITWFSSAQPGGAKRYDNPEFEKNYQASTTEMNEAKRKEFLQKALAAMYEDPPYLFLAQGAVLWGRNAKIDGMTSRLDSEPDYTKIRKLA